MINKLHLMKKYILIKPKLDCECQSETNHNKYHNKSSN